MNKISKKLAPYLIVLFGLFLLFLGQAVIAGVSLLLGLVMIIENTWPEKWDADNHKGGNNE